MADAREFDAFEDINAPIDSREYSLADFKEYPHRDIFAKAQRFQQFISDAHRRGHDLYRRTLLGGNEHRVTMLDPYTGEVRDMVMMASNNYLGLTTHPKVVAAGRAANDKYGAGAGSVPLLAGTLDIHRQLEQRLAKFKGCEDAIIFTSGYSSNVGCVSGLVGQGDVAINDRINHASIVDGCRLSGGETKWFRHNDMKSLNRTLRDCDKAYNGKLVIVDGVFSMDGDIAPLPQIVELAKQYGARVMIDEAHASGVIGEHGRGTPEHWHMEGQVDIVAGTLSKGLGGVGGFVASSKQVIDYLRFYARSYMFSTAMTPAITASLIAAIDVIENEPELRERLWANIRYMMTNLRAMGFDLGNAETAIIPIIIADDLKVKEMAASIHKRGVFVNPVFYPAVAKRKARIRLSLMATHTQEDLDQTLAAIEAAAKEHGVLPKLFGGAAPQAAEDDE
ncbi:MAG: aminotransferase class I/II-fold pyridoxal phosphate-dependent enzyme [Chloroflexota bacterium]